MGKGLISTLISITLFSSFSNAQSQPASPPELAAFSDCLITAVDAERTDAVTEASLDRVKSACAEQQKAMTKALPAEVVEQILALLDEALRRELRR